jgi:DNA-binding NarL/FixJ family response regulator
MSEKRSCIIIDEHPVVRLGLARALADWDCDEAADVDAASEMLRSVGGYDAAVVVLRRYSGQVGSGTELIKRLRDTAPGLGIVARGMRTDRHLADAALAAGALGFVSALADPETIEAAVSAAADGDRYVDPIARTNRRGALTRRQIEVLQQLADGASTEQTAKRLGLSEQTVRTHTKAILARMNASGRAHAVALAIRAGLID